MKTIFTPFDLNLFLCLLKKKKLVFKPEKLFKIIYFNALMSGCTYGKAFFWQLKEYLHVENFFKAPALNYLTFMTYFSQQHLKLKNVLIRSKKLDFIFYSIK